LKAIVARKQRFTADFDSSNGLISTENKRQAAPNQPIDAAWHPSETEFADQALGHLKTGRIKNKRLRATLL
jgi:hypothetical protein